MTPLTKSQVKALAFCTGNAFACHIGPVIPRKTWDSLLALGFVQAKGDELSTTTAGDAAFDAWTVGA